MGYLPLFADVGGQPCLVIGGDQIAEVRVRALLDAGAGVTVIAPALTPALAAWEQCRQIVVVRRQYLDGDLNDKALVFCTALTEDLDAIAASARALRIPLNITDSPALSSFIVPAVVRRGDLQVAVSTGGASPALAGILREELEQVFGPEYASLLDLLRSLRDHLRTGDHSASARADLLRTLATELRAAILQPDYAAVEAILERHLGITPAASGVDRPVGR